MNRNVPLTAAAIFVALLAVSVLATGVVAWSADAKALEATEVKQEKDGGGTELKKAVDAKHPWWELVVPFYGLPANGRLADASGWVLWLTDADAGRVKPDDLTAAARKFRFGPSPDVGGWRWWVLRQTYAVAGTDLPNVLVLSVLYALGWHAIAGLRARRRVLRRLAGEWDLTRSDIQTKVFGGVVSHLSDGRALREAVNDYTSKLLLDETVDPLEEVPAKLARAAADALLAANPHAAAESYANRAREIVESDDQAASELDYFSQAIPPLGFIGTVLGIGEAMIATRNLAAGGGLSEVAASLGVAFNTTFLALALFLWVEYLAVRVRKERAALVESLGRFFAAALFVRLTRRSTP